MTNESSAQVDTSYDQEATARKALNRMTSETDFGRTPKVEEKPAPKPKVEHFKAEEKDAE